MLSQEMSGTTRLRTSGPRRAAPTRRSVHRRAAPTPRPAIQTGSISVDRGLLGEVRDWAILAGVSLAGWASVAVAIGVV
jgi:hypothetical protein